MELNSNEQRIEAPAEVRLPWHKPEVQRLVVSFDTRTTGSPVLFSEVDGPSQG